MTEPVPSTDVRGDDPRTPVDVRIDSPGREGLTGTAPANLYRRLRDAEEITLAPDGRPMSEQPAWRTDFPIDWPQDQYVERRDFMKFMVLVSLSLTIGQFWIAAQNWWRRRRGAPPIARIASVNDLPVGGAMVFTYPEPADDCLLVRPTADSFVAYLQKCTHLSCAVRPRASEGLIACPCHEGYFDLLSGRPIAGPPRRPLVRIRLDVRGNQIYATGVEASTA
jgi:nitrite reductase/ring-hydroxylating ferredoxin subunit